ncbi:MAG: Uncharacterised protein [Flavobacteriia bacterium]|nr:MAG: Uncharacterised protein [Flavobacteriia bacterium]
MEHIKRQFHLLGLLVFRIGEILLIHFYFRCLILTLLFQRCRRFGSAEPDTDLQCSTGKHLPIRLLQRRHTAVQFLADAVPGISGLHLITVLLVDRFFGIFFRDLDKLTDLQGISHFWIQGLYGLHGNTVDARNAVQGFTLYDLMGFDRRTLCLKGSCAPTEYQYGPEEAQILHSHSIVAGGLLLISYTTRLIPETRLMI